MRNPIQVGQAGDSKEEEEEEPAVINLDNEASMLREVLRQLALMRGDIKELDEDMEEIKELEKEDNEPIPTRLVADIPGGGNQVAPFVSTTMP